MTPNSSDRIPGYRLLHEIGRGGMATVYRAVQESLGREVALKVMAPELARDPAYAERFLREGKVVARLRHRNIVTVHDLGLASDGAPFIAMEYVPGGSVAARMDSLDTATSVRCIREIAGALDHAHRNRVIHRDVKPENILCHEDGSFLLSDFGVARVSEATSSLTAEGATLGTPQYMSPEQWRGEDLDGRTDLYALGVVLYQLLTGSAPYSGTDGWAIGMQHMVAEIPRLPADKAAFQPLLDSLLAKQREQRPANGQRVVERIDELMSRLGPLPAEPMLRTPAGVTTPMPIASIPRAIAVPPPITAVRANTPQKSRMPLYVGLSVLWLLMLLTAGWAAYRLFGHRDASTGDAASTATAPLLATPATVSAPAQSNATATEGAPQPDAVVRAQLDRLGIKYEIDHDGDFKIVQPAGEGRTQMSWVRSQVSEYKSLRIREIMSIGYRADGDELPADIARQLLRDTHEKKLGAWTRQGGMAIFVTKIPADADADQLKLALDATRETADTMEKTLTGAKDEF
jgi:serine/threonine-protein kinase PpkA